MKTVHWCMTLGLVAALGGTTVAAPAFADRVATPEEVRALKARFTGSPPTPADYAAQPYPAARFDADCSARESAPRQPDGWVYCYYTLDSYDEVRAYLKAGGKPGGGVHATVEEGVVSVDGQVTIDNVRVIRYFTHPPTMAFYASFPADPPPATELIAPLYPGARYDKDCSAARSLEIRSKPKWRQVWCFVTTDPAGTVGQAFDSDFLATSKRGVDIDIVEVSRTPPVTQIEYWLTAAPAAAAAPAATQPTQAATDPAAAPAAGAEPQAAPEPAPKKKKKKDSVNPFDVAKDVMKQF